MAILNREQLCLTFVNGAIPSQKDFCDLIDSVLNRRDDQFFGVWQQGMKYCDGDVVIYNKAIYKLVLEDKMEDCPSEDAEDSSNENEGNGTDINASDGKVSNGCKCSIVSPAEDPDWCLLELTVDDKDWSVVENDAGEVIRVYNLKAKIGIGTEHPQTRLEVSDNMYGRVQVELDKSAYSAINIQKLSQSETHQEAIEVKKFVQYKLSDEVEWVTDTLGYAFIRELPEQVNLGNEEEGKSKELPVLLFITSETNKRPTIGVGTTEPKGILHTVQEGRGDFMVNGGIGNEPSILLANTKQGANGHYLMSAVSEKIAYMQTDAPEGFRLKKGGALNGLLKNNPTEDSATLLTVRTDGKVGIGTEEPKSKLEVQDSNAGTIRLDLSNNNPSISTINWRPISDYPVTYSTTGVDDLNATFITNAENGFVFKKGGPHGHFDNEVNINQGDNLMYLSSDGKLGIQTTGTPQHFEIEVEGRAKFLTTHLETDGANIEQTGDLEAPDPMQPIEGGVLEKMEKLQPIKFRWKQHTNAKEEGEQIGFNAYNVFECFPELIKSNKSNGYKSVAYSNMTAVLVQAIKDQQVLIRNLEKRVNDLEKLLYSKEDE